MFTYDATIHPRMVSNLSPLRRAPPFLWDDGLCSTKSCRTSTTASDSTKTGRTSIIIITWAEVSTSASIVNSITWIFEDFFILLEAKMEHPTKSGVCIPFGQWEILKKQIEKLHKTKPYLVGGIPCYRQPDHMDLMTSVECKECNPFSDILNPNLNFYGSSD